MTKPARKRALNMMTVPEISVGKRVKENSPKVSIIIPVYDSSDTISEALESVLTQKFTDFEIILIDDGSSDQAELEKTIEPFLDKIIYIKQENKGAGAARNIGIENARGEYLAFLDSDDIWLPGYLQAQIRWIEEKKMDLIYADAVWFGGSAIDGKTFMQTCPSEGKVNTESLLEQTCTVLTSATVVRRSAVLNVGMFENRRVRAHDFVLWLKLAEKGFRLGYQKKTLLKHRISIDSLSGDSVQRVQREINVYRRIKHRFDLNADQEKIVEWQIARLRAEKELEIGKSKLLQENFSSALESFKKANEHKSSLKLKIVIYLLKFFPKLLLKIYRSRREEEIAFVPKTEIN